MGGKTQFFIITTILLAAIATGFLPIIINYHRHHHHHPPPPLDLPSNAAQFLRSNGFTFLANLIHISPNLFLSTPESTIFAIPDSAISNLSIPPYMTIELITYHISPNKFTLQDLFQKPLNTCFSTLFQQQKISITKKDEKNRLLEINNVLITIPDMFVDQSVAIHGVSGPFASFKRFPEINELPICTMINQSQVTKVDFIKIKAEWKMVVKFLSLNGFTPFAFWLYNVLDGIVKDHPDLHSMTIFAPPVIEVMEVPAPMVPKFMRAHVVPKKYSFKHLVSMSRGASIATLCPGREIEITGTVVSVSDELLSINRVEVTSPDLLSSRSFVVHGIARAFAMDGDARLST
ncbi:putative FAS1 domain-containing protein [Helianthus annuus]|nr:putative FAS1 domain-containing protein [Helianthus annuus]